MRLTFRVTTSGNRWAVDAPTFDYNECWPAQDTFDEAAFRRQLRANERYVQMGSHDNDSVMRFSSLVFHAVSTWLKENVVSRKDRDRDLLRAERTMRARQRRGKFGFVRMEIRPATIPHSDGRTYTTVSVKVTFDDKDVPGCHEFCTQCAMYLADIANSFDKRYRRDGRPGIVLTPETREMHRALHERTLANLAKKSNWARFECAFHRKGFCAPIHAQCPHYRNGRCEDVATLVDDGVLNAPTLAGEKEIIGNIRLNRLQKENVI